MVKSKALLIIDVQNDFCCGGALPVPDAESIIPVINRYSVLFREEKCAVYVSRDWHPADTAHFAGAGGIWPAHCVRETTGARFHPQLTLESTDIVVSKGIDPAGEGYSAFEAQDVKGRFFEELLREKGVKTLYVAGLATDYCVKHTVCDALKRGFEVFLLIDAVRGVDEEHSRDVVDELLKKGVRCVSIGQLSGS